MRLEAKRLTKKETLKLLEYAYLAGEKTGQDNAKNIYWHAREKIKPSEAFRGWRKEISADCRFLA